jgi:uncharacterized protein (TIGR01777 family)
MYRSSFQVPAQELFRWHARRGAFERLAPPWEKIRIVSSEGGIENGNRLVFSFRKGPLKLKWEAVHEGCVEGKVFTDRQVEGPFAEWVHEHRFIENGPENSVLEDGVRYALPMGFLGRVAAGRRVKRALDRTFSFRHDRTAADIERHRRFASAGTWKIAVSGATGLVGSSLAAFLGGGGHSIVRLSRRRPAEAEDAVYWNPSLGEIDAKGLEGTDAVVHLAGENISEGRWNPARKASIRRSRVEGTRLLASALAGLECPPKVLVCASAIGFYGDRGDEVLEEDGTSGGDFLASVCRDWEEATVEASQAGIRVVNLRIGVVLAGRGGALRKMLTPFSFGLGGRVGSGRQYMSWIGLDDLLGVIQFCLFTEGMAGPVNAVAPCAVTNAAFVKTLARVMRRPAVFPLPAPVVKAVFGEMGKALLLSSTRVRPARLLAARFPFLQPDLEGALRSELGLRMK